MNNLPPQLWFADTGTQFHGDEPYYFDNSKLPWTQLVEANWHTIKEELQTFISKQGDQLQPYHNSQMVNRPNRWRTLGLMFWGLREAEHCAHFPQTWQLLQQVPGLLAVSFNLLEEQTTIKPHYGNTNAIFRCHLGLQIPASAPHCGFRVGNEVRSWEEGKLLVFCDAHEHTAWNNARADRYVLVMDVIRPEFTKHKLYVASRVLASIYLDTFYQKLAPLKKFCNGPAARNLMFKLLTYYYRLRCNLHALLAK